MPTSRRPDARAPLAHPGPEQIARETRSGEQSRAAERAWRRAVRRAVGLAFLSQLVATGIGIAGFMVDDLELGWVLVRVAQVGVVLFPFLIGVLWVIEAHRRGDL